MSTFVTGSRRRDLALFLVIALLIAATSSELVVYSKVHRPRSAPEEVAPAPR